MQFSRTTLLASLLFLMTGPPALHAQSEAKKIEASEVGADTKVSVADMTEQSKDETVYWVEDKGQFTWRSAFDKKMDNPTAQWQLAQETREKGRLKAAERRMMYLYRRWPNSKEAPWAARARADMLFERKEWKAAFTAYQYLIDNYSGQMEHYDSALEAQYEIAVKIMNHRRLRWVFGGYRAPEYAVEYFEKVVRNGPQWSRAPEAQFMVGQCNQGASEYELAISAYEVLGYRYPDSAFAEEAAWQQIECYRKLRKEYPAAPEILDRMLTASTVFLSTYPKSEYRTEIIRLRNSLYEVKAKQVFDEGAFYAKVPKEPEAAIIYYEKMIEEYPKSKLVPKAYERIEELKKILAMPTQARTPDAPRSRPIPFTKGGQDVEG
ncbi:outer membrane protein assembly factor BamD [Pontiella agarivorans]|uniref:Outer membrane protein assembly factor BamD n=1 Tax=Pontiella agarivorans TaxID=3038953 RepID=A0ABU5N1X7_9BACT|nr:outer membrane protein assembly factor BamD [Pontiella agarivorans]MDZ8120423.1 outer membrane protein assembly factor BamD [Pontiella agarivorans]